MLFIFLSSAPHCYSTLFKLIICSLGWALQAFRVAADEARTHTLHLRAWGAAPARSTHGLVHHDVPPKHTLQAAQHAAAAAALEYAKQLSAQNISTTITLASVTTLRDLQDPHDPAAQPVQRPADAAHGKRRRLHDGPPQIAGRRRPHAKLVARNRAVLVNLQATSRRPYVSLRGYPVSSELIA